MLVVTNNAKSYNGTIYQSQEQDSQERGAGSERVTNP